VVESAKTAAPSLGDNMGGSHNGQIDDLQHRLNAALAREDGEEVRNLLAQIGKAELNANTPKNRIRPLPIEADGPS
jgi:hypothetical protein